MVFRAPMRSRMLDLPRFAEASDGALVWTRDTAGMYWLGRIAGPVREIDAAGLSHARPAEWLPRPFGPDTVPAAVAATFARGGLNFQRTHSDAAVARSDELWRAMT